MPTITDYRLAAYVDAGFTGTIDDAEFAYLRDAGYTGTLDDMRKQLYADAGFTNEKDYWLDRGYTGAIGDMVLEAGIADDILSGGGSLPGEIIFSDTFTGELDGTDITTHTPDVDAAGLGWRSLNLGAFPTLRHHVYSGGYIIPSGTNSTYDGSNLGGLLDGISMDIYVPDVAFTGARTQIHPEKISFNGFARALQLYFRISTGIDIEWGQGGGSAALSATWDPLDGAWNIPEATARGTTLSLSIVMDRTSDTADVTINGDTHTFELKTDIYTMYDGSADHWGIMDQTAAYRQIDNVVITSVST